VLLSPDDLERMEETIAVLSDSALMAQLIEAQGDLRADRMESLDDVREAVAIATLELIQARSRTIRTGWESVWCRLWMTEEVPAAGRIGSCIESTRRHPSSPSLRSPRRPRARAVTAARGRCPCISHTYEGFRRGE